MAWTDFYNLNINHNLPFSSIQDYAPLLTRVGFTEQDLGVRFVYDSAGNVSGFARYNPLSDLGRQANLEPVPAGVRGAALPEAGTPSLHNWSVPHAAANLAADEF